MKFKAVAISAIFLLMAILPFGAGISAKNTVKNVKSATTDETTKDDDAKNRVQTICIIMENEFGNKYSQETLNALAILINTNIYANPDKYNLDNYDSDLEITSEIAQAAELSLNKKLYYNDNGPVFVPYSVCSNGATMQGEYTYLSCVASPQDCLSDNYNENNKCCGISIDGIEYLCNNGVNSEEALLYYLPNFNIK